MAKDYISNEDEREELLNMSPEEQDSVRLAELASAEADRQLHRAELSRHLDHRDSPAYRRADVQLREASSRMRLAQNPREWRRSKGLEA